MNKNITSQKNGSFKKEKGNQMAFFIQTSFVNDNSGVSNKRAEKKHLQLVSLN